MCVALSPVRYGTARVLYGLSQFFLFLLDSQPSLFMLSFLLGLGSFQFLCILCWKIEREQIESIRILLPEPNVLSGADSVTSLKRARARYE
ncbi:hypothetical protein LY78DRAFT_655322 [Colletotrichum sublineola]|nr:hypothetical protein LY78DRAFT_655322 [Colletotrichum sublineola]